MYDYVIVGSGVSGGRIAYELQAGGDAPSEVALRILPRQPGSSELRLRLDGSPPLLIRQHVLP